MSAPIPLRWDFDASQLRSLARRTNDGPQAKQVGDPDLDIARLGIAVKPSDSRAERYVDAHGSVCWEADVLPAVVIEQVLDDEIRSWLDVKKWQRRATEIERARGLL